MTPETLIAAFFIILGVTFFIRSMRRWSRKPDDASQAMPGQYWTRPGEDVEMASLPPGAAEFILREQRCPYCHHPVAPGPSGGASQNFLCTSITCNSRFNVAMIMGADWGEFMGKAPDDFINRLRVEKGERHGHTRPTR